MSEFDKQKDYDLLLITNEKLHHKINNKQKKINELEAKLEKAVGCVEFYASDSTHTSAGLEISLLTDYCEDFGTIANKTLKELGELK